MSRIGKNPVEIPAGVDVKVQGTQVTVKGPKGELKWECPAEMKISVSNGQLSVERPSESKPHRSLHGTTRSILANMVTASWPGPRGGRTPCAS